MDKNTGNQKVLSFSEKQVEDHWERLKSAGLDLLSNARLEKIVRNLLNI